METQGEAVYEKAFEELGNGKKETHWMWFVLPQVAGLGQSEVSKRYAINSIEESTEYLNHPILGARLIEITRLLLMLKSSSAEEVFGFPDYLKLKSSMMLFSEVEASDEVFLSLFHQRFGGARCVNTLDSI